MSTRTVELPGIYKQLRLWSEPYHDSLIRLPQCDCDLCTQLRELVAGDFTARMNTKGWAHEIR